MNKIEADLLQALEKSPGAPQRQLAKMTGSSLGLVNKSLKELQENEYIKEDRTFLPKAEALLAQSRPEKAIILAAGYGMRMVPINTEVPKGLLEIDGIPLIERQIQQLHEAGVYDIEIVVGYLKEQYEYLIDLYGVDLIINMEYADKNNLISLEKALNARREAGNTYIIPCDLYARDNPFSSRELYSWYMVSDRPSRKSPLRINRKGEFVATRSGQSGQHMVGISYLKKEDVEKLQPLLQKMAWDENHASDFWEDALFASDLSDIKVLPREVKDEDVVEINTYEQLRDLDQHSNQLNSPAIHAITEAFHIKSEDITNIRVLKKGMTNRSFLFEVDSQHYIMRIPGEGTDQLINRREEADVYHVIQDLHLCDDIVYINPDNGYKITRFIENTHTCSRDDWDEITRCMDVLRNFHNMHLSVDHDFDVFRQIEFYESLRPGKSIYRDYEKTKEKVFALKDFVEAQKKDWTLCHIDSVMDNFLIDENGQIRLIDWEYAGMQDPHIDLAMNCVYAMYNEEEVDRLIDTYFHNQTPEDVRLKIYAYIAMVGLLWSNWCEYKASLGLEFGEYALKQYRFAKQYTRKLEHLLHS